MALFSWLQAALAQHLAAISSPSASLRSARQLEDVETRIVLTQRDLRLLQTEIGTRGRLSQLERWNAGAFSLSAPAANQFVQGGFELAKLTQPERQPDFHAPVVLASAPAPVPPKPQLGPVSTDDRVASAQNPGALLHEASLKTETREVPVKAAVAVPQRTAKTSLDRPVTAAKPASIKSKEESGLAAAKMTAKAKGRRVAAAKPASVRSPSSLSATNKKSVDKPVLVALRSVTRRVQFAKTDPLAPLPLKHSGKTKDAPTGR